MKAIYFFIAAMLLGTLQLSAQTWQWTKPEPNGVAVTANSFTDASEQDDTHDVETDASGNVYVLGDFMDSLYLSNNFITRGNGSYLAKYDSTGSMLWYKLIIPTYTPDIYYSNSIRATDLTVNAQGVFITGRYIPSGFQSGSYDCTTGVQSGLVRSYSIGSFNFNSVTNEIGYFVTKFNSSGNIVWNQLGTAQSCFNGVYSSPYTTQYNPLITSDKNNNIICELLYGGNYANLIAVGSNNIPVAPPTNNNAFIVFKMNSEGTLQWSNYAANTFNSPVSHDCNSIVTDNNGNAFIYGLTSDSCVFGSNIFHTTTYIKNGTNSWSTFIAKISSTGTWDFVKELYNGSSNTLAGGVGNPDLLTTDNANNVYALTNIYGTGVVLGDTVPIDKTNTYLVKLDNSGNLIWHKGFASYQGSAYSVHFANNSLYISGGNRNFTYLGHPWYFSDLTVKPTSPNNGGPIEYYISKATTDGNFQWVTSFSGQYGFMEGFAVKAFNDNIYTSGYYSVGITTLGNLNGTYNNPNSGTHNLFFGKLKDQYIHVGALSAKQVMPGCSITVPFTSTGLTFSGTNRFTAELSNASGDFTTPTIIGTVKSTGTGSIRATIPTSLAVGSSGYKIRIRSTDTLLTGFNYFAYADTGYTLSVACPATASGLSSTGITGTTATLNWAAVGCAAGYKVQYRIKGTTAWTTLQAPAIAVSAALTGLTVNTIYQWRIATKCNNNSVVSFSPYSPIQQFKTAAAFAFSSETASAIANSNGIQLAIQPNPAKANAVMVISGAVKNATVTITDFVGKTVWRKDGVYAGQVLLPVQNLAAGVYLVKLVNGNETRIVKLVKE